MTQSVTLTNNEEIQTSVYTRWHQLSVPLAFSLAVGSFMLGVGSAIMALSVPEASMSLAIVGGLEALFGLTMPFGRRD